jgi:hypothetical protein
MPQSLALSERCTCVAALFWSGLLNLQCQWASETIPRPIGIAVGRGLYHPAVGMVDSFVAPEALSLLIV